MANKPVLKKEDKKESKQPKQSFNIDGDAVVGISVNKLKVNSSKGITRWSSLSNTVTINAYD